MSDGVEGKSGLTLYGPYILESVVYDGFAFIKKGGFHMSRMAIIGT